MRGVTQQQSGPDPEPPCDSCRESAAVAGYTATDDYELPCYRCTKCAAEELHFVPRRLPLMRSAR